MSETLASQVAAGEVIERPASVVKELVENAIDAGARKIEVEIQRGGVALIRVRDDGSGMGPEDAELALKRHATSKLKNVEDLSTVLTMGFRGEALPSIASVARFSLMTREAEAVEGIEIRVEGERVEPPRIRGCPVGTVIEVRDLFFNIPARKKFLKAETTEAAHVEHQVRLHALANPEVGWVLRKDGRLTLDLPAVTDRRVRIAALLGKESGKELIEVPRHKRQGVSVEGALLPASYSRRGRRHQFLFLNGRPVEDTAISGAIREGFRGGLAEGQHPAAWLWLQMDPTLVDVNVHPAKREVRFRQGGQVRVAVMEAVEQALRGPEPVPPTEVPAVVRHRGVELGARGRKSELTAKDPEHHVKLGGSEQAWAIVEANRRADQESPRSEVKVSEPPAKVEKERAFLPPGDLKKKWCSEVQRDLPVPKGLGKKTPQFRILGALREVYVVMEGEEGLVLLEPRCAFERIFYERLLRKEEGIEVQQLLVPILLELDGRDVDVILQHREHFEEAGISLEAFGGNTVQAGSLPAFLKPGDVRKFLTALIDDIIDSESGGRLRTLAWENFAAKVARQGAQEVDWSPAQVSGILRDLFQCDLPYCDPAGRPVLVQISLQELGRKFGK